MNETIEQKCVAKGVKLTEQRKIIAKALSSLINMLNINSTKS